MNITDFLLMNLALVVFYATYRFLLIGETHFRWARAYLVTAMLASFALPLLVLPTSVATGLSTVVFTLPVVELTGGAVEKSTFSLFDFAVLVYFSVALFLAIRSLWRIVKLKQVVKNARPLPNHGNSVFESPLGGSFSFLGKIYLETGLEVEDQRSILNHELVHLREKHAIDLFFAELTKAVFWINPIAWLYGKRLAEVHEFTADQQVTAQLANKTEYQELLVAKALGINRKELVHSFINKSMLKRRIMMINKPSSSVWSKFRYALFIPVLGGMIALASCQKNDESEKSSTEAPVPPAPPSPNEPPAPNADEMEIIQRGEGVPGNFTQPEFPGGQEELFAFIIDEVEYPPKARANGTEGNVFTGFTVNPDGSISDIKIVKGVSTELDAEAIRVLNEMPSWEPGLKDEKPVAVEMTLPISFQLPNGE